MLLLDNSGSMERADRVQIIHEALRVLAGQLQPQDKFSVVTFARTARLWAGRRARQPGGASRRWQVSGLTPQGGTNLEDAMNLAYQTALRHYLANGINRVVLLTDGAANLGNVDPEALKQKVEANRKQGIALDCFGIGWEGYNDDLLEVLSRNGDGRYAFLNTPEEVASEFAAKLAGALHVAASDVKVQVEFNPAPRDGVSADRLREASAHQGAVPRQHGERRADRRRRGGQRALRGRSESAAATARSARCACASGFPARRTTASTRGTCLTPATRWRWSKPARRCAWPPPRARSPSGWRPAPMRAEVTPDQLLGYLSGVPEVYGADARPKKLEWMIRQAKSIAGK